MTSFKDKAKAYEPKQTLNITDLEKVDISWPIETRTGKKKNEDTGEDETFTYDVMIVNEKEYRVPNSVTEKVQEALKIRSDIEFVKVTKKGSGLATRYSVEVLDKTPEEKKQDVEDNKPELKQAPIEETDKQKIKDKIVQLEQLHTNGHLTAEGLAQSKEQLEARLKELE